MSSGSSNRYQSKLFNFVYQQTQRLTQTWENIFKNLQVATRVGYGSLLYPLYQLLPQKEWSEKKIQPIIPPETDAAIQHILDIVKNLPAEGGNLEISQKTNPLTFIGSLWGRFFPKQSSSRSENTLQKHIPKVQGIATELKTGNLVLVGTDNRILDIFTTQENSQLKQRINRELIHYEYPASQKEILPEIDLLLNKLTDKRPTQVFGFLDKLVANLEMTALVSIGKSGQKILDNLVINNDDSKTEKADIANLITAAINYFLGGRNIYQIESNAAEKAEIKSDFQNSLPLNHGDTWLTWDDLFGNPSTNISDHNGFNPLKPANSRLLNNPKKIAQKAPESENQEWEQKNSQTNQGFNFQPDWIDISATSLGYEKHPLEQILHWLDQLISWIEQILTNTIYFFRGLLLGR
ncbi:hypothetical protein PN492_05150 [Dolichospermum circinale CS-537/01]|uniref:Uncharacterized protein n=1 Tax=Dolichospermum circinale CS-537/01 TaxID=3021739 RepID=A0ABT5A416_9CYAN|nr:hypothetical protein [Dolichospermum circinale]MDB9485937.1 hypothetical protein [Dolichospermum circinale CS-537/01]